MPAGAMLDHVCDERKKPDCLNERRVTQAFLLLLFVSSTLIMSKLWVQYSSFGGIWEVSTVTTTRTDMSPMSLDEYLQQARENGKYPCHLVNTTFIQIFGLPRPEPGPDMVLATGVTHRFTMVAYDANGTRRCHGGDFFETDLSGEHWKSRPLVQDMGDGSYMVEMLVDHAFPGLYKFNVILLYSNFHGIDRWPGNWIIDRRLLSFKVNFVSKGLHSTYLSSCLKDDFRRKTWWGRWTRTKLNKTCVRTAADVMRFQCMVDEEPCDLPWCDGQLGKLDSNGWVYSAHCRFHLWSQNEAWECLKGKKIFFWGDSNHQDTVRNLLNFVLGFNYTFIERFVNITAFDPSNSSRVVQVISLFNGHGNIDMNELGLKSLDNQTYATRVSDTYTKGGYPDVLVMNSGLHDGFGYNTSDEYVIGARKASKFWRDLLKSTTKVIFRTTIVPAGIARPYPSNPHKTQLYNQILAKELLEAIDGLRIVDAYDMTFPWHYDNTYSDGGHYGRLPFVYFTDVMLVHTLLNYICQP